MSEQIIVVDERLGRLVVIGLAVSATALIAMVIGPSRDWIERVDDSWLDLMVDVEVGALLGLAHVFAFAGRFYVLVPLRLGVLGWLARRRDWLRAGLWIIVTQIGDLSIFALKVLFDRDRPPVGLTSHSNAAFPSGHSASAAIMGVAIVLLFTSPGVRRRAGLLGAGGYLVAMALSRTYLRVHWLSDVIAGVVIGATITLAFIWLARRRPRLVSSLTEATLGWLPRSVERRRARAGG